MKWGEETLTLETGKVARQADGTVYPATVNHEKETRRAIEIAKEVVDPSMIDADIPPTMGGEDFSYMLQERT